MFCLTLKTPESGRLVYPNAGEEEMAWLTWEGRDRELTSPLLCCVLYRLYADRMVPTCVGEGIFTQSADFKSIFCGNTLRDAPVIMLSSGAPWLSQVELSHIL